ncbi:MAG: Mitogen-activated protein kinase 10 [Marteilia pararefringens]
MNNERPKVEVQRDSTEHKVPIDSNPAASGDEDDDDDGNSLNVDAEVNNRMENTQQDGLYKLRELINNIKITFMKGKGNEEAERIKVKKVHVDNTKYYIPVQFKFFNLIGKGSYGNVLSVFTDSAAKTKFLKFNERYDEKGDLACMAIKYLYAPFRSTFIASRALRELSILRALDHPNLIKIHYAYCVANKDDDLWQIYLCTELAHTNLKNLKKKTLTHSYFSYIIYQIVCGLLHMHDHHIIHRDLKPANIVIYTNCHVKILDFGLSRTTDIKMTPYVVTRYYRAPEIIFGMEYNEKVDLWSVGCILGELLIDKILLCGKSSLHQWMLIVELLGIPSDEFFKKMPPKLESMVKSKTKTYDSVGQFDKVFNEERMQRGDSDAESKYCLQLLRNLLVIDSQYRWNDQKTLNSDYLATWQEEEELNYRDLRIDLDFSFEKDAEFHIDAYRDAFRNLLWKSEIVSKKNTTAANADALKATKSTTD